MMPHESWLATQLLLAALTLGLVIIAIVCGESAKKQKGQRQ